MSTRSRANPWFRDEQILAVAGILNEYNHATWSGAAAVLPSGMHLWKQPGGDPVADMRNAIAKLEQMR